MTSDDRAALLRELIKERFGTVPRLPLAHPGAESRGTGIPDQHTTALHMQTLAGYGWTPAQISEVTGVPVADVRRTLARLAAAQTTTEGSEPA